MRAETIDPSLFFTALDDLESWHGGSDLGGSVYKQRIARRGSGKSGGYRVIVLVRIKQRAVFVNGYTNVLHRVLRCLYKQYPSGGLHKNSLDHRHPYTNRDSHKFVFLNNF